MLALLNRLKRSIHLLPPQRQSVDEKSCARSPQARPAESQWQEPPADKIKLLERFDKFAVFRNGIRRIADEIDEWAGVPMPLEDAELVIEPTYPKAAELMAICRKEPEIPEPASFKVRNRFWSEKKRSDIVIFECDGKVDWGLDVKVHNVVNDLTMIGVSVAWGLEQEGRAVHTLGSLLRHHQMKQYLLTGMFLERSHRSGLTYMFRKLRPTVVLDTRDNGAKHTRILCALCMHPIAYYAQSGAGAMAPTDDVVAHLMLMRGDEPMFWRRSNQHPPWRPEARLQ